MFGSAILEVGVGLVFCFLGVSLVASGVTETVARILNTRANNLYDGIKAMLNDATFRGLARDIYNHAATNPRGDGETEPTEKPRILTDRYNWPTAMRAQQFAGALIDIIGMAGKNLGAAQAAVTAKLMQTAEKQADADAKPAPPQGAIKPPPQPDKQLSKLLNGILSRAADAQGNLDLDEVRGELAGWFDNTMVHLSDEYRQFARLIAFITALIVAGILNIDALHVGQTLWQQAHTACFTVSVNGQAGSLKTDDVGTMLNALREAKLPIGWEMEPAAKTEAGPTPEQLQAQIQAQATMKNFPWSLSWTYLNQLAGQHNGWAIMILGWLITALATLFGALFWFDAINRLLPLRNPTTAK